MKRIGLIQVYTGRGKGKTTAALGLVCRARGYGLKVCYIYFHKQLAKIKYGEFKSLKKLGVDIFGFAKKHPHFHKKVDPDDIRKECLKGIKFIKKVLQKNKYDILILDEVLISLRDGFLKEKEILDILNSKPENLEVILTGRGATQKIIKKADLISRIEKIKHPFDSGIKGRKGIEY
jgi:cob(I)alamin adenosyltransferase